MIEHAYLTFLLMPRLSKNTRIIINKINQERKKDGIRLKMVREYQPKQWRVQGNFKR
jgi:hypothetical protein